MRDIRKMLKLSGTRHQLAPLRILAIVLILSKVIVDVYNVVDVNRQG